MKLITADMLREKGACPEQVAIFEREWPEGARVTRKNALRAVELELHVDWVAVEFLSRLALAEYDKATALAWAAYPKATAPARAAYRKAIVQALCRALKEEGA